MLVATHKSAPVPSGDFYLPVHVGHTLNPIDLGFQPDDDGENISAANGSYCELTAVYWAWKNLESDIVGLSHYRRYFAGEAVGPGGNSILSRRQAVQLMEHNTIVLAKPRNYVIESIETHYRHGHYGEDLDILRDVLSSRSPELRPALETVLAGRRASLYNMMLMRWPEFDSYCTWLFDILAGVENRIDNGNRNSYQQRTFGFLGERLLNVWALASESRVQVARVPVINTEGEPTVRKGIAMLRRRFAPAQP